MRRIEKFLMPEPAKSALPAIRLKDSLSKRTLMQADPHSRGDICPAPRIRVLPDHAAHFRIDAKVAFVVDGNGESRGWRRRIIAYDENRPGSDIAPSGDSMKVNQWQAIRHRGSKSAVIPMIWIDASIPVSKKPILAESIVIRTVGSGRNGEGHLLENAGLEYALGPDKGDSNIIQDKTLRQQCSGQYVPISHNLVGQPFKSRRPYPGIMSAVEHSFPHNIDITKRGSL
jgi:hypothetical protein